MLDVILHVGAHRTGTTSFQRAMHQNRQALLKNGTAFWGPGITRSGRFSGLLRGPGGSAAELARQIDRNRGLITIELQRLASRGVRRLVVSEENVLGSMAGNLKSQMLYAHAAERAQRFHRVFGKSCVRIGIGIRPYAEYWASSLAFAIAKGHALPDAALLDRLVTQPRSWRRLIEEVARAFPAAEIVVWEFGQMAGRVHWQYRALAGPRGHLPPSNARHNASPDCRALRAVLQARGGHEAGGLGDVDGRYQPFGDAHRDTLAEIYTGDLDWLRRYAPGRIRFVEETGILHSGSNGFDRKARA